ncbi:hypothetical protein [Myroides sp. LoEW2-1]|uniref:hypothetical protein n=1 Tax=Myroides sp. LoEW2-1 TaxID=2683192 RepID=UPI001321D952|nr:hypothetical protein [Myroides sp. LoEW2-1]MVX36688.1 hypothetical protein [Myroides sp. LoEW2-1]
MRKSFILIISLTLFLFCQTKLLAQFPYQSTLTSGNEFAQFNSKASVTFDKNGATLTPATGSTTRGFYLNDLAFTVNRGFIIEFDYLMTGGSGFADGLALVLFDGLVTSPQMGSDGSGLGYSYKTSSSGGLSKGFLAVGVDLWGAFKFRRAEKDEYRNGIKNGAANSTLTNPKDNKGAEAKSHVTIRGQGNGSKGYPVLITQSTEDFESRTQLDFSSGKYIAVPAPQETPFNFSLRENKKSNEDDIAATYGHPSYRRVEISMLPGEKNTLKGFYLSVDVLHGSSKSRVIKDYFLPDEASIKYIEATAQNKDIEEVLDLKAPNTFKIGFVASTGGYNQKHIVRNLSLYMPFSPSIRDLFLTDICKDVPTEIDILANSVGFDNNKYQGEGDMHDLGSSDFLDAYSFQFRTLVNGLYEDTAQPYIATTNYGTYEYNPATKKAIFTPKKGVAMPVSDQVFFTIRNKEKVLSDGTNLGSEQFRSNTGTVRLTFGVNCNEVLMVNGNSI